MKFFKSVKNNLTLSSLIDKSIKDGYWSQSEAQEICDFARDNDIAAKTMRPILIKNFNTLAKSIQVNEEQYQVINQIIDYFGIVRHEIPLLSIKLDDYVAWKIETKQVRPTPINSPIILQENEQCFFVLDTHTKKEKVVSKNIKGGSAGLSFRIAKGVTLRTGSIGGQITNNTQMVIDSTGRLVITDQRIIYVSDKQNFECNLDKLLSYQVYSDGIQINPRKGKSWLLYADYAYSYQYLLATIQYLLGDKSGFRDYNKHLETVLSYDDGNLSVSFRDELFENFEQAIVYKEAGELLKASELLEKSTNPPSIYHGHYEQLFIIYRQFYKDDLNKGDYLAVINRINKMLRLNDEMKHALNEYWRTKSGDDFDGSEYNKILLCDAKALLKAGQAIGDNKAIKTAENLIKSF